jgi:hypothetical protein
MPAKPPRRRGRPSSLTPERADTLVGLFAAGATVTDAAATVGVTRRTVELWRARAYSTRPEDRLYVDLEKRLQQALVERAARPWEAVLAGVTALDELDLDAD